MKFKTRSWKLLDKIAANLYMLKGEILQEWEASVSTSSLCQKCVMTWHKKLRHMSTQGMKILVEKNLLWGLTKGTLPFC